METSPLFTVEEKNLILLARFAHGESLQSALIDSVQLVN
jgi:hypothetical protein